MDNHEEYFDAFRLDVRHGQRQLVAVEFWKALDFLSAVELHLLSGGDYWDFGDYENALEWLLESEIPFNQFAINDFMALG